MKQRVQTLGASPKMDEFPFSTLFHLSNEAIVVIDEQQNILLINQSAEKIFGYAALEVVGKPLDIFLPSSLSKVHSAHINEFRHAVESSRYMHERTEIFGRRKNGDIFPAEASIIKVNDGSRILFTAILRDMTLRREFDQRLATFSHAIEQAGDLVFITDHQGMIEYVNPAFEQITGYSKADVLGKNPRILKSGLMPKEYYQQVWQTIVSGEVMRAEVLDRKKNGELFYYDQTIAPLKDSQGKITHFISTGKDMTIRKRAEQEVYLLLKLIQGIAEAESFDAALNTTLKLVCETMGWDFGEVWVPSPDATYLELGAPYYSKFGDVEKFRSISSQFEFAPGDGLPGRVWKSGQPAWIVDISVEENFMRAEFAKETGFKTVVGIPVMANGSVVTVLEFFMREQLVEDGRMMALSAAITAQLGTAFQRKQTDEALKKSEARLREAQRIANMGNWEIDLLTNQFIGSDEIFRIFEIDKDKFGASYEAFLNVIHPEDRESVDKAYIDSLKTHQPYEIVHRLLMPDGRVKFIEERCENFYAADGMPIRSVGIVQDVSERVQIESQREAALTALHENEQRLRMIFETMSEGIALNEMVYNENGEMIDYRILDVNAAFHATADCRGGNVVGSLATELYGISSEFVKEFWKRHKEKNSNSYTEMHSPLNNRCFFVATSPFVDDKFVTSFFDITEQKRAEAALREKEELFRTMVHNSSDLTVLTDENDILLFASPQCEKILGYSGDEYIGKKLPYNIHPDDLEISVKLWEEAKSSGKEMRDVEYRVIDAQGKTRWLSHTAKRVMVNDKVLGMQSAIKDITERKQADEALRISEEKYRTVADFTYDWEAWREPSGAYIYVSPSCERITGHTAEEFLIDSDLVLKIVHPQDLPKMRQHREEVARQTDKKPLEYEFRIIAQNGETHWISHTCLPVYSKSGEFLGRRENNREVTARKRIELELRDSEQRLREIVDAAPFGAHVYQLDEKNQLIFMDANQSADTILEVDNSIFIGKTIEEAFPSLVDTELPAIYRRVAQQGFRYDLPRFSYKDERLSALLEIHIIQIALGRIAVFFRNITELVRAYDETIVGWSRAMDFRDNETEDHTQRVTYMTVELARAMGFGDTELSYIRWGALLHDIGKIGIPDAILLKPGKLTEEEWVVMRKHVDFAHDMLYPISFLRPALDIPYCHHEKWNGTGYPRGLKGEEIPLPARIFALVDVWDALRSHRPYRQPWSREKVTEHIRSLIGIHFAPNVAEIFLDFIDKTEF